MPRRKPVTLKDIADRLDVSTTVVSTVLNNRRSNVWVSDTTRESVLAVARELGYVPRTKKAESILHTDHAKVLNVGILCMPWYSPLFGKTVSELCRTLGEWKFHPFIHVAPDRLASCKAGRQ
ncbi:MAG TPA: LacI family DNA-binding transcriptional regulator, partial [Chthonomonadales bacterium]|nr:LacI family DNA-binding transcriptional regulator [Chthonomonadales bacterium]